MQLAFADDRRRPTKRGEQSQVLVVEPHMPSCIIVVAGLMLPGVCSLLMRRPGTRQVDNRPLLITLYAAVSTLIRLRS